MIEKQSMTDEKSLEFKNNLACAESGDVEAMLTVAAAYYDGDGVNEDLRQFFAWMEKAANTKHPEAMYYLGLAYYYGDGVDKDLRQYFAWVRKAVDANFPQAMFELATAYKDGLGVKKSIRQYSAWMKKAKESSNPEVKRMNWQQYEKEVYSAFKAVYPDADMRRNIQMRGRISGYLRQIDILVEDYVLGHKISVAVDAKFHKRKIDVKTVESFISMVNDIGVHKGILVSNTGYTDAAIRRCENDDSDIVLDILNFTELRHYQGTLGIPYAGDWGVIMPAPFGWVIDNIKYTPPWGGSWVACLYQRGRSNVIAAFKAQEVMYVNLWDKRKGGESLDDVLRLQEKDVRSHVPGKVEITFLDTMKRSGIRTVLRKIKAEKYPVPEYTGFVEFEDFIFFAVMLCSDNLASRNIPKLGFVMRKVMPIKVIHSKK